MLFKAALDREVGILWEVTWWPEDTPLNDMAKPIVSYCVAPDMNAAFALYSSNVADLVSVKRVHNGGIYIPDETS